MANVFIKNVDAEAYRLAKAIAAKEDKKIGQVVSESLRLLARERKQKKGFAALTPVNLGKGTENLSMQIDEILYGD